MIYWDEPDESATGLGMRVLRYLSVLMWFLPGAPAEQADPSAPAGTLEGEVRDDHGPVAAARVRYKGTAISTVTDAAGRFQLPRRRPGGRLTAWKEGYFIAGAEADASPLVLHLHPLPAEDFEDYAWVDPSPDPAGAHNCANCHGAIYREWRASGHSRSASGRRFRNLYEGTDWQGRPGVGWSLLADYPDAAGVCTACHAPTVPFSEPAYFDLRQVKGVPAEGVHCDYCHKVADAPTDNLGRTHGRFGLLLRRPRQGQLFFGPLDDVDRGEDVFAALYRESRYCASCHEGTVLGVPAYTTWSEWLESPARRQGKQCQTCHMTPSGSLTNIAPGKGGIERDPQTLGNHRFFAGSQADMLRRCLVLQVELRRQENQVQAEVEVRAEDVGHRVPTGFPDRQVVLVVEGLDASGQRGLPAEGPQLEAAMGPALAGRAGRLYVKLLSDSHGRRPVPFWRARTEVNDSRLRPGQPDRSSYRFPAETAQVRVRLLHRKFWQQTADDKGWPGNDLVIFDQLMPVVQAGTTRWSSRGP
jgi:hypothetical protein